MVFTTNNWQKESFLVHHVMRFCTLGVDEICANCEIIQPNCAVSRSPLRFHRGIRRAEVDAASSLPLDALRADGERAMRLHLSLFYITFTLTDVKPPHTVAGAHRRAGGVACALRRTPASARADLLFVAPMVDCATQWPRSLALIASADSLESTKCIGNPFFVFPCASETES